MSEPIRLSEILPEVMANIDIKMKSNGLEGVREGGNADGNMKNGGQSDQDQDREENE